MSHIKLKRSIEMKVKSTCEAIAPSHEEVEEAGSNNIYTVDIIVTVNACEGVIFSMKPVASTVLARKRKHEMKESVACE